MERRAADTPIPVGCTGEVLVALINNRIDFAIAREEHWYRIPVDSAKRLLGRRWPPHVLALYQTKVFGPEAYAINYYAEVEQIRQVQRWQLFPEEPREVRGSKRYFQLMLSPLISLPMPILSRRWRRIVFIPTTWAKFTRAVEINDLFDESPLEDRLWAELRRWKIMAERQFWVAVHSRRYALDFAILCDKGNLDVETDGDTWHADSARIWRDNQRDNDLTTAGWRVLRFNGMQLREQIADYCVPTVLETIERLGGLRTDHMVPRRLSLGAIDPSWQPALFEESPGYEID
jgi:very-short-patch-repair endonuclease